MFKKADHNIIALATIIIFSILIICYTALLRSTDIKFPDNHSINISTKKLSPKQVSSVIITDYPFSLGELKNKRLSKRSFYRCNYFHETKTSDSHLHFDIPALNSSSHYYIYALINNSKGFQYKKLTSFRYQTNKLVSLFIENAVLPDTIQDIADITDFTIQDLENVDDNEDTGKKDPGGRRKSKRARDVWRRKKKPIQ